MKNFFLPALLALGLALVILALGPGRCQSPPQEICDNGQDDDGDRHIDCEDFDCAGFPGCEMPGPDGAGLNECRDRIDNDGDEFVDCDDFSCKQNCYAAEVCSKEENTLAKCRDGIDNDGDEHVDCDDFSCKQNVCPEIRELCNP